MFFEGYNYSLVESIRSANAFVSFALAPTEWSLILPDTEGMVPPKVLDNDIESFPNIIWGFYLDVSSVKGSQINLVAQGQLLYCIL
jgi:hypothetical protein